MNLISFLSIVITVTGLVWLLQLLLKGKDRIDINLSVGRTSSSVDSTLSSETATQASQETTQNKDDGVLGKVLLPQNFVRDHVGTQPKMTSAATNSSLSPSNVPSPNFPSTDEEKRDDAYIDKALQDETLENYTSESLLKEATDGQLTPAFGYVSLNPFASIANELPAGSFDTPQGTEQIEAMFELLRENTRRIEQQMMALYVFQRASLKGPTQTSTSSAHTNQDKVSLSDVEGESSGDYDFSDDNAASPFGGGLNKQLNTLDGDDDFEAQPGVEFFSAEELGGEMPADACQTYDLDQIRETPETAGEITVELLPYMAALNKTGELSHDVVNAIRQKETSKVVKHRVRQLLRAIDHYRLSGDSNAALRVTAVMSKLPVDLGKYANAVSDIGRKFGLTEPEDEPAPVETDEILVEQE